MQYLWPLEPINCKGWGLRFRPTNWDTPSTMTTSLNVANSVYLGTLMTFARSSSPNLSEVFLSLNFEKLLSAPMSWGYISSNFSSLRSGRSSRIVAAFWKNVNPILFHSGRRELLRFRTLFFKSGFGKLGEIGEHAKTVLTLT